MDSAHHTVVSGKPNSMSEPGRAAVLWTGGKDSTLALFRAKDAGADVRLLATFVPEGLTDFKAHPIPVMKRQADQLGLEHREIPIAQPYRESYIAALRDLREWYQLDCVVTGDIDLVEGHTNWIAECCEGINLRVFNPLWQANRENLLRELLRREILAQVSWIKDARLPRDWLGRRIDTQFIHDIIALSAVTGIDICGENGEYHTTKIVFPKNAVAAA
jgi:diphthine-ammonia ligase